MQCICPKCLHTGEPGAKGNYTYKFPLSGFLIGFGVNGFVKPMPQDIPFDFVNLIALVITTASFCVGLYFLYRSFYRICPKCSYSTMIGLNTPEAQELIRQNRLEV